MTFTVTYRGKDGAKRGECIDAANRAECVAECKRRGITPVAIREGGRGKSAASPKSAAQGAVPRYGIWRAAILAAAVLAVVGSLWWWLGSDEALPKQNEAKQKPTAAPRDVKTPDSMPVVNATNAPAAAHNAAKRNTATPQAGTVVERIRTDDGKLHSKVYSVAEPVLTTRTDQLLAMAVEGDGNGPPMPAATKADEQQFLESLKKPIEILETDTPDVRALKEKVIQARADMVELLAQGRGFSEVLAEHQKLQAENAAVRRDVAKELRSLMDSGDTAAALEYRKRMNAALEQMGIAPLTTAITEEERAERAERRRASRKERLGK